MIQRDSDGLFSSGGQTPTFSKNGKAWTHLSHLKNHLHQFHDYKGQRRKDYPYTGCTVVVVEKITVFQPASDRQDWNVDILFEELCQKDRERYGDK